MESFKRGFAFLKQSWQMAFADRDLIKPSIFALVAGIIVTLVMTAPLVGMVILFGDSDLGQPILYVYGALMIFVQYATSYVFSAMTVYLIYGYLAEGDGVMEKAWAIVKRDFWDILSLAAASAVVTLIKNALSGKNSKGGGNAIGKAAAGIIGTIWTEASYLVLPVMVIEDVNLVNGLKRVGDITRKNLLLIGISTVGVGAVTGLIGFLLGATGVALGVGVGFGIVSAAGEFVPGIIGGITLGVLIASIFIMAATIIGNYTTTAYHTCLYLWAREAEKAQEAGSAAGQVAAPAPLASVLG